MGLCAGPTKRGKVTKILAIIDSHGLPVSVCILSSPPHEVKLLDKTLDPRFTSELPKRLIGDKAYDSCHFDSMIYSTEDIGRPRPPTPTVFKGCADQQFVFMQG